MTRPSCRAHVDDAVDRAFAEALDRGQAEAHALRHHREVELALVDVGRQHRDAALARFADVDRQLVGVGRFDRQQRGGEVPRVVRLQVRRLVGEKRVGGRVRLVEAVAGEELHQLEDLAGLLLADALGERAGHEGLALLGHDLGILLAHRLAQHVGLPQREAGEHRRHPHDLFLVGDDAVGVGEDRLERGELVLHQAAAGLAIDVVVHHAALEGAGPVERVHRDQILEPLRLGAAQDLAHARAFELEDAVGLAVDEQLIRLRIVERDGVDVERDALGALDLAERVLDQRQRAQAQEVHLEQADALDLLHRPLGRDFVAVALEERRVVGDRTRRDHDAGGVDAGVSRHAFEALAHLEHVVHARVGLRHLPQHRVFGERFLERHVERRRNLFRDAIDVRVGQVHHAADVADHGLRLHGAERDDLRHVLAAVLRGDVLDHLAAAALAEVDVDIRQRDALRIEEALENQVVVQRVDVGDAQRPGHEAAGRRAAAGADRNAVLARVADEVPDDQEVPGYSIFLIIAIS